MASSSDQQGLKTQTNEDVHAEAPHARLERPEAPRKGGPFSGPIGVIVSIILLAVAGYYTYDAFNPEPKPDSPPIDVKCKDTDKVFKHKLTVGEKAPFNNPETGKATCFPVEKCFWIKKGNQYFQTPNPTLVILNEHLGMSGPTICHDCGMVVEPHNPLPPDGTPYYVEDGAKPSGDAPATRPATGQSND